MQNTKYKTAREDLKNSKIASQKDYQDLKIKSEKDSQELKIKHSQEIEKYKAEQSQLQEPRVEIKTITQEVDSQKLAQEIEQIKTSERFKVISEIQKDSPKLTKILKLDEYKKPNIFIPKDTSESPYVKKFKDTVFYKSEQTEIQPDAKLEELTKKVSELENKTPKIEYRDREVVKYKEQPENETYNEVRGIMKATNEILKMQDKPLAYSQKDYQELKLIKDNSSKLNELKTARQKSLELEQEKFKRTQEEQKTRINTLETQSKTSNVQTYQPTTTNATESEKTLFERVRECLTKEQIQQLDKIGSCSYEIKGDPLEKVIFLNDSEKTLNDHYRNLKSLTIEQKPQEQSKSKGMSR